MGPMVIVQCFLRERNAIETASLRTCRIWLLFFQLWSGWEQGTNIIKLFPYLTSYVIGILNFSKFLWVIADTKLAFTYPFDVLRSYYVTIEKSRVLDSNLYFSLIILWIYIVYVWRFGDANKNIFIFKKKSIIDTVIQLRVANCSLKKVFHIYWGSVSNETRPKRDWSRKRSKDQN